MIYDCPVCTLTETTPQLSVSTVDRNDFAFGYMWSFATVDPMGQRSMVTGILAPGAGRIFKVCNSEAYTCCEICVERDAMQETR